MSKYKRLNKILVAILAVLAAFLICSVLVIIEGKNPLTAYGILISSVFSNIGNFGEAVVKAVPISFTGLAVVVAYRCGTFNLGAEGQLIIGAVASIGFAVAAGSLPPVVVILGSVVVGAVFGALWSLIPAVLKAKYSINEIITTILMNYIALWFVSFLVNGPLQEKSRSNPQTDAIEKINRLPILVNGTRIHLGVIILIIIALLVYYYLFYNAGGYKMRAVGLNRDAAEYGGINIGKNMIKAMLISGAIAGIGGTVEMLGIQFRYIEGFGSGYGFDGVAMALIGQLQPLAVLLVSFLFGILRTGANSMQRLAGVPTAVIDVIQALTIFFVVSAGSVNLFSKKKSKKPKEINRREE